MMAKAVLSTMIVAGLFPGTLWADDSACVRSGAKSATLVRNYLVRKGFNSSCVENTLGVADTEAQYAGEIIKGLKGTSFFYENLDSEACPIHISIIVTFVKLYNGRCEALRLEHLQATP